MKVYPFPFCKPPSENYPFYDESLKNVFFSLFKILLSNDKMQMLAKSYLMPFLLVYFITFVWEKNGRK